MKLEFIDKIFMSSALVCLIIIFVLLVYHRLKYYASNFEKFEYYLVQKSNLAGLLILSDIIFQAAFTIGVIFLLGYFTSIIIF